MQGAECPLTISTDACVSSCTSLSVVADDCDVSGRGSEGEMSISGHVSSPREQLASLASRTPRGSFSGKITASTMHASSGPVGSLSDMSVSPAKGIIALLPY